MRPRAGRAAPAVSASPARQPARALAVVTEHVPDGTPGPGGCVGHLSASAAAKASCSVNAALVAELRTLKGTELPRPLNGREAHGLALEPRALPSARQASVSRTRFCPRVIKCRFPRPRQLVI